MFIIITVIIEGTVSCIGGQDNINLLITSQ